MASHNFLSTRCGRLLPQGVICNWLYTQDVYVVEINGVYYLCNASYPGVNLMLSVTL